MTTIGYIVLIAAVTAAVAVIVWDRRKSRRLLNRLDEMLDKAITQGFTEEDYDESLLSAVENKLARYLAASTVSARNLQTEKDAVKTLVAAISHQTKTPLSNILLYAQLLSEQQLPEESRRCVTALQSQSEKLQAFSTIMGSF